MEDRLNRIACLLDENSSYWRFPPFAQLDYPWRAAEPELCEFLEGLTSEQIRSYQQTPSSFSKDAAKWIPVGPELVELSHQPPLTREANALPEHLFTSVPGRKVEQIRAFCRSIPNSGLPFLEWCSGKGHLSRALVTSHGGEATCLEIQERLCDLGRAAARGGGYPLTFVHGDAKTAEAASEIRADRHAVALHACGDLHTTLLKEAIARGAPAITISPCCYHLTWANPYVPFSKAGEASGLQIERSHLRMVVQETVVAGAGARRKRHQEVSYRLGFDSLQRQFRGIDEYLNVPSIQKLLLREGMEGFSRWAAGQNEFELPEGIDFNHWEQIGKQRFETIDRMELIRGIFRRPLEIWLVLDRACLLEEAGYQVKVGIFCERETTPRNLIIHGEKPTP